MEIPGAQIPLPYISKPSIQPVRPASVPLPGTRAFDYHRYEMAQARRKQYYFDINNFGQINSWADVITRTFNGTHDNPITGFMEDTKDLLWNGSVRPILENDSFGDMARNLWHNTWVNIIEDVDVVDNIWKGYVLEGNEGAANAFKNRHNYYYNTGNIATDLLAEMATPTTLLSLGASAAAKAVATTAIKSAGMVASKSLIKGIAKYGHLTDDLPALIKALQKSGRVLTEMDVAMIRQVSLSQKNIKLLKSLNFLRSAGDAGRMLGPRLAYYTSIYPTTRLFKMLNSGYQSVIKYGAAEYNRTTGPIQTVYDSVLELTGTTTKVDNLMDLVDEPLKAAAMSEHLVAISHADVSKIALAINKLNDAIDIPATVDNMLGGAVHAVAYAGQGVEAAKLSLDNAEGVVADLAKTLSTDPTMTWERYKLGVARIESHPRVGNLVALQEEIKRVDDILAFKRETYAEVVRRQDIADIVGTLKPLYQAYKDRTDVVKANAKIAARVTTKRENLLTKVQRGISTQKTNYSIAVQELDHIKNQARLTRDLILNYDKVKPEASRKALSAHLKELEASIAPREKGLRQASYKLRKYTDFAYKQLPHQYFEPGALSSELVASKTELDKYVEYSRIFKTLDAQLDSILDEVREIAINAEHGYSLQILRDSLRVVLQRAYKVRTDYIQAIEDIPSLRSAMSLRKPPQVFQLLDSLGDAPTKAQILQVLGMVPDLIHDLGIDLARQQRLIKARRKAARTTYKPVRELFEHEAEFRRGLELNARSRFIRNRRRSTTMLSAQAYLDVLPELTLSLKEMLMASDVYEAYPKHKEDLHVLLSRLDQAIASLPESGQIMSEMLKPKEILELEKEFTTIFEDILALLNVPSFDQLSDELQKVVTNPAPATTLDAGVEAFIAALKTSNTNISLPDLLGKSGLSYVARHNQDWLNRQPDAVAALQPYLTATTEFISAQGTQDLNDILEPLAVGNDYLTSMMSDTVTSVESLKQAQRWLDRALKKLDKYTIDDIAAHMDILTTEASALKAYLFFFRGVLLDSKLVGNGDDVAKIAHYNANLGGHASTFTYWAKDINGEAQLETMTTWYPYQPILNPEAANVTPEYAEYHNHRMASMVTDDPSIGILPHLNHMAEQLTTIISLQKAVRTRVVQITKDKQYKLITSYVDRFLEVISNKDINAILDEVAKPTNDAAIFLVKNLALVDTAAINHARVLVQKRDYVGLSQLLGKHLGTANIEAIHNLDSIDAQLAEITQVSDYAREVLGTMEGMQSNRKIADRLNTFGITYGHDIAAALLDGLLNFKDARVDDLLADPKKIANMQYYIKENINRHLHNKSAVTLKLQAVLAHTINSNAEAFIEYHSYIPEGSPAAHTAIGDAIANYIVDKYLLSLKPEPTYTDIYIDAESSGLNPLGAHGYQLSLVSMKEGAKVFELYVNTAVADTGHASDALLRLLFDGENKYTIEQLRQLYKDTHVGGTSDLSALRTHFDFGEHIRLIPCAGEAELYKAHTLAINRLQPDRGHLRICMMNGLEYDYKLLTARYRVFDLTPPVDFNINRIRDTLKLLEAKYGVRHMSTTEALAVDRFIADVLELKGSEAYQGVYTQIDLTQKLKKSPQVLLPTVDQAFKTNLYNLQTYFKNVLDRPAHEPGAFNVAEASVLIEDYYARDSEEMNPFNKFARAVRDFVDTAIETNQMYGKYVIDGNAIVDNQKLADIIFNGIPKDLRTDNAMAAIQLLADSIGVSGSSIAIKTESNDSIAITWFDILGKERSFNYLQNAVKAAKQMNVTLSRIKNHAWTESVTGAEYRAAADLIRAQARNLNAVQSNADLMSDLILDANSNQNAAALLWLYHRYTALTAQGMPDLVAVRITKLNKELEAISKPLCDMLKSPETTMYAPVQSPHDLFFMIKKTEKNKAHLNLIEATFTVDVPFAEAMRTRETALPESRAKVLLPAYREVYEAFPMTQKLVAELVASLPEGSTLTVSDAYRQLRPSFEAIDNYVAFKHLKQFLSLSPDEMVAHVWYKGKGLAMFKQEDLFSPNYSKSRGGIRIKDMIDDDLFGQFHQLIENKEVLELFGLMMHELPGGWVVLALSEEHIPYYNSLPYPKSFVNYNTADYSRRYINQDAFIREYGIGPQVLTILDKYNTARTYLERIAPSSVGSTLERFDEYMLASIVAQLPTDIKTIPIDVLKVNQIFTGEYYNHSVFGGIDNRRAWMPGVSYNPFKTMFHGVELVHQVIATQVQYSEMLFADEYKLKSYQGTMSDLEYATLVYDYMHANRWLRLAFLKQDAKYGYKLATITVHSVKDVQWALDHNAIALDQDTLGKSIDIINRHKVSTGLMKGLEHILAGYKLGWLGWNIGTVARNVLDSGLKNIQTTQDLAIVQVMLDTLQDYMKCDKLSKQLVAKATKENRILSSVIDDYFVSESTLVTREVFDEFRKYNNNGIASGNVHEFKKYYGDTISKLHRTLSHEIDVPEDIFRGLVSMTDDEALNMLVLLYPGHPELVNQIMYMKQNLLHYKRAYAMHQHYEGQDLTVLDFVHVSAKPQLLSRYTAKQQESILALLEQTKNLSIAPTFIEQVFNTPIIAGSLELMGTVEDIMRISLRRYMDSLGATAAESKAAVNYTHFDYAHKSESLRHLEMLIPFSFFRINNVLYWAEELEKNNFAMQLLAKFMAASSNMDEQDIDDIMAYRSVQYQILAGNIILDQEKGTTLKLNLSAFDAVRALTFLPGYVLEGLHSAGQAAVDLATIEPYPGEEPIDFKYRKSKLIAQVIPLAGAWLSRTMSKDMGPIESVVAGSFINRTWTPQQRKRKSLLRGKYKYKYTPRAGFTFKRPSYFSGKSAFNKVYYGSMYRMNYGVPRATKLVRAAETRHKQLWGKAISKSGRSKHQLLLFPTNKYTLKMKVMLLRQMANSYR